MKVYGTSEDGLIKAWVDGVDVETAAIEQLHATASMPFIHKWVAAMPDIHSGLGSTVGSVVPTKGAIIPACVGVDLGCGMMAVRTSLTASQLPDNLSAIRSAIEKRVPHGRGDNGGANDPGAWAADRVPNYVCHQWGFLSARFHQITEKHPAIAKSNNHRHLGTLGTGNHFIELCLDEQQRVWVMLHSGSRGVGGRIGGYFIELAKKEMERWFVHLPNKDLAYLPEGSQYFDDYIEAVGWAQDFALANRRLMMSAAFSAMHDCGLRPLSFDEEAVNCHHNYVERENHYGANVWVTRKGAVRAREGDLGIIPGSMGAKSFIVRGKGNRESFCSCSHGAGRKMSRTEAKRRFTLADHEVATAGVECRKDADVIDETPAAYKDIDAVMAAQSDLVEVVHTLKQVLCVKG
ncbi:MAG TPA: RtcB family protein [Polyangiaceae bacterium]|nr:RtcB family protein [Polyangiaceae bacterium]